MAHLNVEQIDGLIEAAGVDYTREILEAFWRTSETLIGELQVHLGKSDLTEASQAAHAIKGAAANVGAAMVEEKARLIETACRSGEAPEDNALDVLMTDFVEAKALLEEHLVKSASLED